MLEEYEHHLYAGGRTTGTVRQRLLALDRLARRHPNLLEVTEKDLERYLSDHKDSHQSETRKAWRTSWQMFYKWARKQGVIDANPAEDLEPIHVGVKIPRLAPDDDIQLSLVTATLEQKAMILLGRLGCLRLGEITRLKLRDREGDALRILGKGNKERLVYVNDDLMHVLVALERERGGGTYYFPGRYGGSMHTASVGKIITRVTGWNPHSLRHAGATAAYRATKDLRAVQAMLGHASMATTQRYLRIDEESQRAAAAGTAFLAPPAPRQLRPYGSWPTKGVPAERAA